MMSVVWEEQAFICLLAVSHQSVVVTACPVVMFLADGRQAGDMNELAGRAGAIFKQGSGGKEKRVMDVHECNLNCYISIKQLILQTLLLPISDSMNKETDMCMDLIVCLKF